MSRARLKVSIFENEAAEELVILWKKNRSAELFTRITQLCNNLLDSIIRSEKFDMTVSFLDVKHNLFLQMERWFTRWVPGRGHLYAYISTCAKNSCVSYVTKEGMHRKQAVYTDVPLDCLDSRDPDEIGEVDDSRSVELKERLSKFVARWQEVEVKEACRVCIQAILEGRGQLKHRSSTISYMTIGLGMPRDQAKVILDWCHGAVRDAFLDMHSYTIDELLESSITSKLPSLPDLVRIVGKDKAYRILMFFAGKNIKFPTVKDLKSLSEDAKALQKVLKMEKTAARVRKGVEISAMDDVELKKRQDSLIESARRGYKASKENIGLNGDNLYDEDDLQSAVIGINSIHSE